MVPNKKDIPEIVDIKIEKLSNLGYGIAKYEGYVIFVENACPGDFVKAKLRKKNKTYANASIVNIIEPSQYRIKPFCPMQNVCGACQLQFIDYNYQLVLKKEIVQDAIKTIYGDFIEVKDTIPSPKIKEYRHKIQYPISQTKESKRILAGYYKPSSHELVNIKYCPIQPACCDEIIDFIRTEAIKCGVKGYNEKQFSGDLRHVVIRNSVKDGANLVVLVINSPKLIEKVKILATNIYKQFDNVIGVCVNYNTKKSNLILGDKTDLIVGENHIIESLCDVDFEVGADTFFQINPESADNIFRYVKNYVADNFVNPTILDAYAGITTFGICLSDIAKKVVSVEEAKASVLLAERTIKNNNIKNVELHNMDAAKFFEKELNTKGRSFDIAILDPPRKGCSKESLDYALKLTKEKFIYVSCNPATLARDLKYLKEKGCSIEYIQPFDMFCHTYHVESVAIINLK